MNVSNELPLVDQHPVNSDVNLNLETATVIPKSPMIDRLDQNGVLDDWGGCTDFVELIRGCFRNNLIVKLDAFLKDNDHTYQQLNEGDFIKIDIMGKFLVSRILERKQYIKDNNSNSTDLFSNREVNYDSHQIELSNLLTKLMDENSNLTFTKSPDGCGGAYFIKNGKKCLAVLKPQSRDVGTLYNLSPGIRSLDTAKSCIRPVANYQSSLKESLAYEVSKLIGGEPVVPATILCKVPRSLLPESNPMNDIPAVNLKALTLNQKEFLKDLFEPMHNEEICSFHKFEQNCTPLLQCVYSSSEATMNEISHESFEKCLLLTQLMGETDGHLENYLVSSTEPRRLMKIDSGQALPLKEGKALNVLTVLPHAKQKLTSEYKKMIADITEGDLRHLLEEYQINGSAVDLTIQRLALMKELVLQYPSMSYREMELRMRADSLYELAMSGSIQQLREDDKGVSKAFLPIEELKELKYISRVRGKHGLRISASSSSNLVIRVSPGAYTPTLKSVNRILFTIRNSNECGATACDKAVNTYEMYKRLRKSIKSGELDDDTINHRIEEFLQSTNKPIIKLGFLEWIKKDTGFQYNLNLQPVENSNRVAGTPVASDLTYLEDDGYL